MTRSTKTTSNKWQSLAIITAVISLLLIALSIFSIAAAYPTESHKSVTRELQRLDEKAFGQQDFTTIINSEKYKTLAASPEQQYITKASFAMLIVNVIVNVAIIGIVYRYIRKHRLTAHPVGATVITVTIGTFMSLIFTTYFNAFYLGVALPQIALILFGIFICLVITPLIVAVIARIFQWSYNRKHSFVVE